MDVVVICPLKKKFPKKSYKRKRNDVEPINHYIQTDAYFISLHAWYQKQKEADIITRIFCIQSDLDEKERKKANRLRNKTNALNLIRSKKNAAKRTFILVTMDLYNHFDNHLLALVFAYI